jgi:hypothetical protein
MRRIVSLLGLSLFIAGSVLPGTSRAQETCCQQQGSCSTIDPNDVLSKDDCVDVGGQPTSGACSEKGLCGGTVVCCETSGRPPCSETTADDCATLNGLPHQNALCDGDNDNDRGGPCLNFCPACKRGEVLCGTACVDTASDAKNCGACGITCPAEPNATVQCVNGTCGGTCKAGFANCNEDTADGCETNVASDVNNCGGCGVHCAAGPNVAGQACVKGTCTITACQAGFGDCDGQAADGCETSVLDNPNHCGSCGRHCHFPLICAGDQCFRPTAR